LHKHEIKTPAVAK